jgi:ketol-acid reductoisomerase
MTRELPLLRLCCSHSRTGHGQGLNARDNGLNVIVGVRKDGESWKQAQEDGWVSPHF